MFCRLPQNEFVSRVRTRACSVYLNAHSQVWNFLFDERITQVDVSNDKHSLLESHFLEGAARWLVFLSPRTLPFRGSFSQRIPSWRAGRSRTLSFSFGITLLLKIVFHSTLFSSRALTFRRPQSPLCLFHCPYTHLWLQQRQNRAFEDVIQVKRNAGPPHFSVWCTLSVQQQQCFTCFDCGS